MPHSQMSKRREKPAKPRPDFPLFPHATGRWAKKIKGKLHYFGPWADAAAALARYVEERDDLYAGRKPRRKREGLTVKDLVNKFLVAKKARVDAGELALGTFGDQYKTCRRVLSVFGGYRLVEDLAPDDFEALRTNIAKTYGKLSRKVEIKRVRSIFRYAGLYVFLCQPNGIRYFPVSSGIRSSNMMAKWFNADFQLRIGIVHFFDASLIAMYTSFNADSLLG